MRLQHDKQKPIDCPLSAFQESRYTFHFASEYLDRGYSVILLDGKTSQAPWKEFQTRRPTRDEIRSWFQNSDCNIGILTGALSGLVVLDADTPEDAAYWLENYPRSPLMVETGRGGLHVYYRYPDYEVRNHTKVLGRRIDIRGEGGYVVAPPSRHPETGRSYTWTSFGGDYSLESIPFWDRDWIQPKATQTSTFSRREIRNPVSYIRSIRSVAGQRGHDQCFRATCILRDAGLRPEEALAVLIEWNQTNAEPPWSLKELTHKVTSAWDAK